jgi:hypothetical protein
MTRSTRTLFLAIFGMMIAARWVIRLMSTARRWISKFRRRLNGSGTQPEPTSRLCCSAIRASRGRTSVRLKWLPGNMSRPHFHPNDRFFVVLSGTWWVGTGEKFDPDNTVPMPAGSYVIHYGGKIHYDGAKNEEAAIQVWGMGPATSTPAEKK